MPWRTPAIMRRNIMKKGKKCRNTQDIMRDCMQWALYDVVWGCRAIEYVHTSCGGRACTTTVYLLKTHDA